MEGPELIILKEQLQPIIGIALDEISGYAPIDLSSINKIKKIHTWGKHLIIEFDSMTVRFHFMLFGTYSIDNPKSSRNPTLRMVAGGTEVNFYMCQVKSLDKPLNKIYDWRVDLMSEKWDADYVLGLLKGKKDEMICDVLLDQNIFAGLGNIMKNETLFLQKIHPETKVEKLSSAKLHSLIAAARDYAFKFYEYRKKHVLNKHLKVYHQKICPGSETELIRAKTGKTKRYTYYCPEVQKLIN
jgi:endonuclease VIII